MFALLLGEGGEGLIVGKGEGERRINNSQGFLVRMRFRFLRLRFPESVINLLV